jgi:hypothetical protein
MKIENTKDIFGETVKMIYGPLYKKNHPKGDSPRKIN